MRKYFFILLLFSLKNTLLFSASLINNNQHLSPIVYLNKTLVDVLVKDRFSPPAASRIHAYCNLAFYEVFNQKDSSKSFSPFLKNFPLISQNCLANNTDQNIAASAMFIQIARKLAFSSTDWDLATKYFTGNYTDSISYFSAIESYNEWISNYIKWMSADGFSKRLSYEKYTISNNPEEYKLTPPSYPSPLEPYWGTLRTFIVPSASLFGCENQVVFDTVTSSIFYQMNLKLYKESPDFSQEQIDIAFHWDDNPVQVKSLGHAMLYNFRMTPPSHWIMIACNTLEKEKIGVNKETLLFASLSIAMADAFITCWNDKYKFNTIRPVSYISNYIDDKWNPVIQTPVFPEYPSGHSVVSAAAAEILTHFIGDSYKFSDSTQVPYKQKTRYYSSFYLAAEEAGISRYYGGIHYLPAINEGYESGSKIGKHICKLIQNISQ